MGSDARVVMATLEEIRYAEQLRLQGFVYGAVLIGFVLFEPLGLYGRWLKLRTYLQIFPFYRKGMFQRQKSYLKSDRLK